jgi:hypothetical protein
MYPQKYISYLDRNEKEVTVGGSFHCRFVFLEGWQQENVLVERFCKMELIEPHSKPTHNPFGRTDTKRRKWTNEKGKEKPNKRHCFQENSSIKAIALKLT